MDPVTVEPAVGSRAAASDSDRPAGLLKETTRLWDELRGLAHDHLQLAALETQRAGERLVTINPSHGIRILKTAVRARVQYSYSILI